MTKVVLHGILAFLYGKEFTINVKNGFFALKALDCINHGFIKKIKDLHKKNLGYSMIIDGEWICDKQNMHSLKKIKQIDIVPAIGGGGFWDSFLQILTVAAVVVGAAFTGGATIYGALALGALSVGLMLLQGSGSKQADAQKANQQYVGGQSSSSSSQSKSAAFSNKDNITAQNVPVPLGYGRIRIGTKIIQTSVKTFPSNISAFTQLNLTNPTDPLSLGNIS